MRLHQARGYYLEEIVRELMKKSKFVDVKTGNIEGRGADHQIDSYGTFFFTIPFVYPVRLISEVKWFSRRYTVKLNHIRSFVGVILDISQNYFVPRNVRSRRFPSTTSIKERYTDCGAFFSATSFSGDAQSYAWAHGIYLIPFSKDPLLSPILDRSNYLLRQSSSWQSRHSTKTDVINLASSHLQHDPQLRHLLRRTYSYIGILDQLYPVLIISDGMFNFDPRAPDTLIGEDMSFDDSRAFKERRVEEEGEVSFQFRFRGARFSFSLPIVTARKIIHAIESTYGGEPFAFLDIPILLGAGNETYRRIYRISLALPCKSDMVNALR
ncbi:MAG: hypothetical protein OEZ29_01260 [Candidatus Bathyarchaeota archaeon]|nr:hypothetical protein [Candidatus Bathyarchaeota archaeon]